FIFAVGRVFEVFDAPFEPPQRFVMIVRGIPRFFRHYFILLRKLMMGTVAHPLRRLRLAMVSRAIRPRDAAALLSGRGFSLCHCGNREIGKSMRHNTSLRVVREGLLRGSDSNRRGITRESRPAR